MLYYGRTQILEHEPGFRRQPQGEADQQSAIDLEWPWILPECPEPAGVWTAIANPEAHQSLFPRRTKRQISGTRIFVQYLEKSLWK